MGRIYSMFGYCCFLRRDFAFMFYFYQVFSMIHMHYVT